MAIKLTFGTRIRPAVQMILEDEVDPIIDHAGVRYLINTTFMDQGSIKWTPFDIATQTVIGDVTYSYAYAAHNVFQDAIFGPRNWPQPLIDDTFPSFPTPRINGTVTP
ncbi:MAG: hypothetical protein ACTSPB_21475 [Candidatus Thorarchaeota archaeon]